MKVNRRIGALFLTMEVTEKLENLDIEAMDYQELNKIHGGYTPSAYYKALLRSGVDKESMRHAALNLKRVIDEAIEEFENEQNRLTADK